MSKLILTLGILGVISAAGGASLVSGRPTGRIQNRPPRTVRALEDTGPAVEGRSEAPKPPDRAPSDDGASLSCDAGEDVGVWITRLRTARTADDENGCRRARQGIARLGLAATEDVLLALLGSDRDLRGDACAVLREIGSDSTARRLISGLSDVVDAERSKSEVELIVALARSVESIAAIAALLNPGTPLELACLGAHILERLRDCRATPFLVQALGNDDPKLRKAVAKALEVLGDPEAVPGLAQHFRRMGSGEFEAKCSIGRTIARSIPPVGAVRILSDLAADQRPDERSATLYGFSILAKDPAALEEILVTMRTDSRESVRSTLIASLLEAPRDRVDAPLLEFFDTEPSPRLRREALVVAGRMASPQMVESLAASMLRSGDTDDVAAACAALRNDLSRGEPRPDARTLLLSVIRTEAVDSAERVRSIRSLARHSDEATRRVFEEVSASTEDEAIRVALQEALRPPVSVPEVQNAR